MKPSARIVMTGVAAVVLTLPLAAPAHAVVVPEHAVNVCQTASFYANYDSGVGPVGFIRTLTYGNKVGHTPGVHPVYNGWAATFDFGPNDWGYMRIECIGGYNSW
jgi:hypothetical protein